MTSKFERGMNNLIHLYLRVFNATKNKATMPTKKYQPNWYKVGALLENSFVDMFVLV